MWREKLPAGITKSSALACAALLLACQTVFAQGTTRRVFATGTTTTTDDTYALTQLRDAFRDAVCGDEIVLQEGATFLGRFVLPAKNCTLSNPITVRTGIDSAGAPTTGFPADDIGINQGNVATYRNKFATFQANVNNQPALMTVEPGNVGVNCSQAPCKANGWVIKHIRVSVDSNKYGGGTMALLGSSINAPSSSCCLWDGGTDVQNLKSEIPSDIRWDQNIMEGDPVRGQHRGLLVACRNCEITNSYFGDIETNRADGQGIWVHNTSEGPILVENNYVEGSTQNMMTSGDGWQLATDATVTASPTPTTTSFGLSTTTDLDTDFKKWIGVRVAGEIRIVQVDSLVGNVVTTTAATALPSAPVPGAEVRWTGNVKDLTVRLNNFNKPLVWQSDIVATPATPTELEVAGGTLTSGQAQFYKVEARHLINENVMARSAASPEVQCNPTGANLSCQITVAAVANVEPTHNGEYRLWRGTTSGGQNVYQTFSAATACSGATCTFLDTGAAGTAGTPVSDGTNWSVKNNWESKNAVRLLIEGNRFKGSWTPGQSGNIMLLTAVNQNSSGGVCAGGATITGNCDDYSTVNQHVTVRYNWFSDAAQGIGLTWTDATNGRAGTSQDINIHNNLLTGISSTYGATGYTLMWGGGNGVGVLDHDPNDIRYEHNTHLISNQGIMRLDVFDTAQREMIGFLYRNNIDRRGANGLKAFFNDGSLNLEGSVSWDPSTDATSQFLNNAIATDTSIPSYPSSASNFWPTEASWQASFTNYATCNTATTAANLASCAVSPTGPWNNAGTDGLDLGVDTVQLATYQTIALSNVNSGAVQDLVITTASALPGGVRTEEYVPLIIATSGGTGSVTCALAPGSGPLPNGITLTGATCTLSGTPTVPNTFNFRIRATDSATPTPDTAEKDFSITVVQPPPPRPVRIGRDERYVYADAAPPTLATGREVWVGDIWVDLANAQLKWCRSTVGAPSTGCTDWATLGSQSSQVVSLNDLADVVITSPADLHVLTYDSANSQWINATASGGGGGSGTEWSRGGNALTATTVFGSTNAFGINFQTNGITHANIASNGNISLNPTGNGDSSLTLTANLFGQNDPFSMGFAGTNTRRMYWSSQGGTNSVACGWADGVGADYTFACSTDQGTGWVRSFGMQQQGDFTAKRFRLESGTRPTCNANTAGMFWYVAGSASVKDTVEVCAKDAADAYDWRVIY